MLRICKDTELFFWCALDKNGFFSYDKYIIIKITENILWNRNDSPKMTIPSYAKIAV